jgi:carbon storage regulator
MLVLTRREGEVICIGDEVRIRVVSIAGKKVRLGIDAPLSVRVDREEIRQRMEQWRNVPEIEGALDTT